jgi:hypothetical protein
VHNVDNIFFNYIEIEITVFYFNICWHIYIYYFMTGNTVNLVLSNSKGEMILFTDIEMFFDIWILTHNFSCYICLSWGTKFCCLPILTKITKINWYLINKNEFIVTEILKYFEIKSSLPSNSTKQGWLY